MASSLLFYETEPYKHEYGHFKSCYYFSATIAHKPHSQSGKCLPNMKVRAMSTHMELIFFFLKLMILFALSVSDPICRYKAQGRNRKSCKRSMTVSETKESFRGKLTEGLPPYRNRRGSSRRDTCHRNNRQRKFYREKFFFNICTTI